MTSNRYRRLGPVVLVSFLLALVSLGIHKAEHGSTPQETPCLVCLSADHLGTAPAYSVTSAIAVASDEPIVYTDQAVRWIGFVSPYRSRAPPPSS